MPRIGVGAKKRQSRPIGMARIATNQKTQDQFANWTKIAPIIRPRTTRDDHSEPEQEKRVVAVRTIADGATATEYTDSTYRANVRILHMVRSRSTSFYVRACSTGSGKISTSKVRADGIVKEAAEVGKHVQHTARSHRGRTKTHRYHSALVER